ncbi:hypothetical protein [Chitinilyticum litopenaei]|uniref:hypothetical protein n=1 Tax=Chitinilyticum litopenaei TaxID=1121276 RepID=UPI000419B624|nr:hypothetical protein [Chitinilyticum litopenaei]
MTRPLTLQQRLHFHAAIASDKAKRESLKVTTTRQDRANAAARRELEYQRDLRRGGHA